MSDFQAIRTAILNEIQTAREGVAFYTNRIIELEKINENLGALSDQLSQADSARQQAASAASTKARKTAGKKLGRPAQSKDPVVTEVAKKAGKKSGENLPATGTAFWTGLMSSTPASNQEILAAGVSALGIKPSSADLIKLKQRLANFLTTATRDGSIVSEGSGRARRFSARIGA